MKPVDLDLIRRCKKQDREAFNRLLSRYEGYLYSTCYSFTRNQEEALDMMQEVYLKIYKGLHTFDEKRPLLPWLKKVAVNNMIKHSRKGRANETSLDGEWDLPAGCAAPPAPENYLPAAAVALIPRWVLKGAAASWR